MGYKLLCTNSNLNIINLMQLGFYGLTKASSKHKTVLKNVCCCKCLVKISLGPCSDLNLTLGAETRPYIIYIWQLQEPVKIGNRQQPSSKLGPNPRPNRWQTSLKSLPLHFVKHLLSLSVKFGNAASERLPWRGSKPHVPIDNEHRYKYIYESQCGVCLT